MRVVIDTNDYISALIGKKHRLKLEKVLLDKNIEILSDVVLLEEIKEVAYRNKFRKYVSLEEVDRFVELLKYRLKPTIVTTQVKRKPRP